MMMTMLAKMMMITSQNDVQVHFNEAIRKAVEEKDRRIQELELSLSSQVIAMHIYAYIYIGMYVFIVYILYALLRWN